MSDAEKRPSGHTENNHTAWMKYIEYLEAELDRLRLLAWEGGACPECELESKIDEFGNYYCPTCGCHGRRGGADDD